MKTLTSFSVRDLEGCTKIKLVKVKPGRGEHVKINSCNIHEMVNDR